MKENVKFVSNSSTDSIFVKRETTANPNSFLSIVENAVFLIDSNTRIFVEHLNSKKT